MKKKKIYEQPETAVTRVELESPICSGSVDITNNGDAGIAIESQDVNTAFDYTPTQGSANGGWDEIAK